MARYKVVQKKDNDIVHALTWSESRGLDWIEKYGDSGIFTDKSLTKESFEVIKGD